MSRWGRHAAARAAWLVIAWLAGHWAAIAFTGMAAAMAGHRWHAAGLVWGGLIVALMAILVGDHGEDDQP